MSCSPETKEAFLLGYVVSDVVPSHKAHSFPILKALCDIRFGECHCLLIGRSIHLNISTFSSRSSLRPVPIFLRFASEACTVDFELLYTNGADDWVLQGYEPLTDEERKLTTVGCAPMKFLHGLLYLLG